MSALLRRMASAALLMVAVSASAQVYSFRHIAVEDGLSSNEVVGLQFQETGELLIETSGGRDVWDGTAVAHVEDAPGNDIRPKGDGLHLLEGIELPKTQVVNTVMDVQTDGNGDIWIATDHQGVYIYSKQSGEFTNLVHSPSQSTSISENHVSCIAMGKDGTVALGHLKKGLSVYRPLPFRVAHFESVTWRNVSAVAEDSAGSLWVGTDGYGLFNVTRREHYDVPGNVVVTLFGDSDGQIWVGTYKEGLLCVDDGKIVRHYTKENSGLSDNNVYSLCQDHNGRLWVGTLHGRLQSLDMETGEWSDRECGGGAMESVVMDFAYYGGDTLYAGTLWGLCRINIETGERMQIFANRAGKRFLHEDIGCVVRDSRGNLWLAHGKGLTVWNMRTDSIVYLTKADGLCDDVVRSMCEDGEGRMWIGTSNGLTIIEDGGGKTKTVSLTSADGLLDNNFSRHSIARLGDGNLVLGCYEGYSIVCLSGEQSPLVASAPYEIGEEWTVWTSWQAMAIYAALVVSVLATYLLTRRAKRRAIADAVRKVDAVWMEIRDSESASRKMDVGEREGDVETRSADEEFVDKCVKIVEERISEDITTGLLAEAMSLTRGHLYKRLTSLTGLAPSDFIRKIRLTRACQLLGSGGMQVAEVAYAVGYSSPKIFSRNFKAEYGLTPTEYRQGNGQPNRKTE